MKRLATLVLACGLLTLLVSLATGPVCAGQLEDAVFAAYNLGNFATALRLAQPLAKQGNPEAQYAFGLMYSGGEGVPQDDAKAVKWYRKAAEQGLAAAQNNLGTMYL